MNATDLPEGIIHPGQAPAHWGFDAERFSDGYYGSYIYRDGNYIIISFIEALHPGRGDFSRLVKAIEADGFKVSVPTPFPQMQSILTRWGFVETVEEDEAMGPVKVWVRP